MNFMEHRLPRSVQFDSPVRSSSRPRRRWPRCGRWLKLRFGWGTPAEVVPSQFAERKQLGIASSTRSASRVLHSLRAHRREWRLGQ